MRDTKEKILNESLALFSVRGYDGVSMSDIAANVGIKAASIYKHYSGKEDIFRSIVQRFEEKTEHIFSPSILNHTEYVNISTEMLIGMIQLTFQKYAKEPFLSKCRKLFMISSFDKPEIGDLYVKYLITVPMQYQAELFTVLQKEKNANTKDTSIMAYHFYSPILILLQEYDYRRVTLKEALKKIEAIVTQFVEVYKI